MTNTLQGYTVAALLAVTAALFTPTAKLGAQLTVDLGCNSGSGTRISLREDDTKGKKSSMMLIVDKDYCLEVKSRGDVVWNEDDSDVASLGPNGQLHVTESRSGTTLRIEFEASNGRVVRRYWMNGAERSANEAESWSRTLLRSIARESESGAERRAARMLSQRGTAAVITELGEIRSDGVKEIYVNALLADRRVTPAETHALARALPRMFTRESRRGDVITSLVTRSPRDAELMGLVLEATNTISSGRHRAEVLTLILSLPDLSRPLLLSALRSASSIASDRQKADVLVKVAERGDAVADTEVRRELLVATKTISSSREYRRVMAAVAR